MLKEQLGADTTLGSAELRTLLMLVMRNATTDSPWPISNNPRAKYNDPTRADNNSNLPLWQLVRASTAAPTYFPPETIQVGEHRFVFVDGGVTMYNNPAFQLFLMATVEPYSVCWPTGEDKMLLVSIGTGTSPNANADLHAGRDEPAVQRVVDPVGADVRRVERAGLPVPRVRQDAVRRSARSRGRRSDRRRPTRCRAAASPGRCSRSCSPTCATTPSSPKAGLAALGLPDIVPEHVQEMDSVDHIASCRRSARPSAKQKVKKAHFAGFLG